jgi:hypothetical protein
MLVSLSLYCDERTNQMHRQMGAADIVVGGDRGSSSARRRRRLCPACHSHRTGTKHLLIVRLM